MDSLYFKNSNFVWHNLQNPNGEEIEKLIDEFGLSSYTMQDAVEIGHLPKFEHHDDFDFMLLRFYSKDIRSHANLTSEFSHKVGIFMGANFLISIHQKDTPFLNQIKQELANTKTPDQFSVRQLFYKIARGVLNTYLKPAELISRRIEQYEEALFLNEKEMKTNLKTLYQIKRESSSCSKLLNMTRDVLHEFKSYVKNHASFKDLQELNLKALHLHNQNLENLQSLFTLTLSVSDQRSNEIMKVLTVFSAFFLPLTFITGFYGMNFQFLPGLEDGKVGFYTTVIVMLAVSVLIFVWFKRKKFL